VKEIEENLGLSLVESAVGGAGGGRTVLTRDGEALVDAYNALQERMANELEQAFEQFRERRGNPVTAADE
jgi:molybdate transport repressor ModE-like protein